MCTSFRLSAQDGAIAVGRTMEFPNLMEAKITVLPRGHQGVSIAPTGEGHRWTARYGLVGMDVFGQADMLTDGLNEVGLYGALLYMPGFCDYTSAAGQPPERLMSIVHVVAKVLGTCATVAEAKAAMTEVCVWPWVFGPFGFAPPAHLVLHDASGASAVIEWRAGEMLMFDNPIGVATNSPHLDWHLINLRNYLHLSPRNPEGVTLAGVPIAPLGQGPGMLGLPADSGSPARFVRAVTYVSTLKPVATGAELELATLHLLNNFDIPLGFIRDAENPEIIDRTLWSTVANLRDRRYILRSFESPTPRAIDLTLLDFTAPPRQLPLPTDGIPALALA